LKCGWVVKNEIYYVALIGEINIINPTVFSLYPLFRWVGWVATWTENKRYTRHIKILTTKFSSMSFLSFIFFSFPICNILYLNHRRHHPNETLGPSLFLLEPLLLLSLRSTLYSLLLSSLSFNTL
jgi:hypothetical protein